MHKMTFIPVGGLANRMRAVSSAVTLAQKTNTIIDIVWFQDWALHAPFKTLFCPINIQNTHLREATLTDHILYDRPRKRNMNIPLLFQKILFKTCLYEKSITPLCKQQFDFEHWIQQGNVYMASYTNFLDYSYDLLRQLFIPLPPIQVRIDQLCQQFSPYTLGVHIRRTDNTASIKQNPIELFFAAIDKEINLNVDVSIYLATDDESVKQMLQKRYGKRLIFAEDKADRSSITGIQGGIVDMYALAQTQKIYGSFQSSFSELAAQIGNIPLEIIKKE